MYRSESQAALIGFTPRENSGQQFTAVSCLVFIPKTKPEWHPGLQSAHCELQVCRIPPFFLRNLSLITSCSSTPGGRCYSPGVPCVCYTLDFQVLAPLNEFICSQSYYGELVRPPTPQRTCFTNSQQTPIVTKPHHEGWNRYSRHRSHRHCNLPGAVCRE